MTERFGVSAAGGMADLFNELTAIYSNLSVVEMEYITEGPYEISEEAHTSILNF